MQPMIEVRAISKQYQLGHSIDHAATARELLVRAFRSPFKRRDRESERGSSAGSFWAVKEVSFDAQQGEIVGIIGANGAGKSTLLKILSRITDPTSGTVTLRGRMASLLEVGTGFHPELTGRENIFLNGAVLGMRNSEIKARFDEIVAFAEVEKFLDTPVKHYSSGMSVRLGFAVAAHLQPEILVVDEVLAVGDVAFQKKCMGKMSEVSRGGRTVLFVSHNMAAVENLCKRGIVLEHGHLVFDGDVKGAIGQYLRSSSALGADGCSHSIDLTQAPSRKPHYSPVLEQVELFTDGEEPAPRAVQVGGRLKLKLSLRLPPGAHNLNCGIGFNSMFGQRVLTLHTAYDPGMGHETVSGLIELICDIPSLTLVPGEYSIFLFVDSGKDRKDGIPDAFLLSVLASDYYGNGRSPDSGVFVIPHAWSMRAVGEPLLEGVPG